MLICNAESCFLIQLSNEICWGNKNESDLISPRLAPCYISVQNQAPHTISLPPHTPISHQPTSYANSHLLFCYSAMQMETLIAEKSDAKGAADDRGGIENQACLKKKKRRLNEYLQLRHGVLPFTFTTQPWCFASKPSGPGMPGSMLPKPSCEHESVML